MNKVVTIVSPSTFLRWLREERKAKPWKQGRPRTADERHLNYLVAEWLEHYHEERPHQALETAEEAARHNRGADRAFGRRGLLKSNSRKAA